MHPARALQRCVQAGRNVDADLPSVDADQSLRLQPRQRAGHRFQLQRQEIAELGAGHARRQLARAEAHRRQPGGEVEQEGHHPLVGAKRAQGQHPVPAPADLAGEDRSDALLEFRERVAQLRVRQFPHLAHVERDRVAGVGVHVQRTQPEQVAAHAEAGDLLAPVLADQAGLEAAGMDVEQRLPRLAGAEQRRLACTRRRCSGIFASVASRSVLPMRKRVQNRG